MVSHACSRAVNRQVYADLQELGWRVAIITAPELRLGNRFEASDPQEPNAPEVQFLPLIGESPRLYRFRGLKEAIVRFQPDWVIADNDPHSVLALQLAAWKKRLGYRLGFVSCENLSFTPRALFRRRGFRGLALGLFSTFVRARIRGATDMVWTINSAGLELFGNAGFRNVKLTPLGFPAGHFHVDHSVRAEMRERLGLQGPVVAYFGRLSPEKGVHLLLDALEGLAGDWTLMIDEFMPSGDYQRQLWERLKMPAWNDRVRWVQAAHGEVAAYMKAADIVVLPSMETSRWIEQYGRVAPEAMASGCVVLASHSGALPELLGDAGLTFPPGDVAALRSILAELIDTLPTLAPMRERAATRARDHLSSTAQARIWTDALG